MELLLWPYESSLVRKLNGRKPTSDVDVCINTRDRVTDLTCVSHYPNQTFHSLTERIVTFAGIRQTECSLGFNTPGFLCLPY
jgi:hypothetical protein